MKKLFRSSGIIVLVLIICSCKEKPTPPTVLTTDVAEISYTTATASGNVTDAGGEAIISRGVCWNTSVDPTISNSKTTESGGSGAFTSTISQLTPNTMYYVRAYATNSEGTGYGNHVTFITNQIATATLTTTAVTSITSTTASSGGNITSDNGGSVTARGVCWSTNQNPTTSNDKSIDGIGTGIFTSSISGLTRATMYYVRAYAINEIGTEYGSQLNFITLPELPTITTSMVNGITATSAKSGGNVTNDGGTIVLARGVCWSMNQNPTILNFKTVDGLESYSFTSSLTGLSATTTYYLRAYATNSVGTAYGNQVSFTTTQNIVVPSITTTTITIFTFNSATVGGNISTDGNSTVTERGVFWGTSPDSELSGTKLQIGSGIGSFSTSLSGLTENTSYYVKTFATNSAGTAYGNEINFILWMDQPGPQVTDIDANTYNSVKIGNQIWLRENLKTTKYRNGDLIGTTTPATLDIFYETDPKYQWSLYGDESHVATYGRLYTWYAVTDSRNVCPTGWHVPTSTEWWRLINYLGGTVFALNKLKEAGTIHWHSPNGTNESGFSALPAGARYYENNFTSIGYRGAWWRSGDYSTPYAPQINVDDASPPEVGTGAQYKVSGLSVRCIKDN